MPQKIIGRFRMKLLALWFFAREQVIQTAKLFIDVN